MIELTTKRTRDSKTFEIDANRRKYRWSHRPFRHYQKDGQWVDVVKTSRQARGDYLVDQAPYALRISSNGCGYRYTNSAGRELSVKLVRVGSIDLKRKTTETPDSEKYQWSQVGVDTDYVVRPLNMGVATELVLHSANAPRSWRWEVIGAVDLLRPIVGRDAKGRYCEIEVTRDGDFLDAVWTGRVTSRRILRDRSQSNWTTEVEYPVRIDPTVNEAIVASADDVHSLVGFNIFRSTGYTLNPAGYAGGGSIVAGLRFQTVAIPNGATIDSAVITLQVTTIGGSPATRFYFDDVDDAAAFSTGSRPKNITKTTAFAAFSPGSTGSITIDVQSVAAEVFGRGGWASNNDVRGCFFDQVGSGYNYFVFADIEHATLAEAQLDIDYTEGGGGGTVGTGLTNSILLQRSRLVQ